MNISRATLKPGDRAHDRETLMGPGEDLVFAEVASRGQSRQISKKFQAILFAVVIIAILAGSILLGRQLYGRGSQPPSNGVLSFSLQQQRDVAALARFETQLPAASEQLRVLSWGDWGREGMANQTNVAHLMGRVAKAGDVRPTFLLSTGDNFYPAGLSSAADPLFAASFSNVYTSSHLDYPTLSVLGNHDYGDGQSLPRFCTLGKLEADKSAPTRFGSKEEQVDWALLHCADQCCHSPVWQVEVPGGEEGQLAYTKDSRWTAIGTGILHFPQVDMDMFFLDTTPMDSKYTKYPHKYPWISTPGGVLDQDLEAQYEWFEGALKDSKASWKVVVGHHTIRSNAVHGDTPSMVERLVPLFNEHKVQLFFNGHDHNLQHVKNEHDFTHYITTGAGSSTRDLTSDKNTLLFGYDRAGFVDIVFQADQVSIAYQDEFKTKPMATVVVKVDGTATTHGAEGWQNKIKGGQGAD